MTDNIRTALDHAASSLETIWRIAGRGDRMMEFSEVRAYAAARAEVARAALAEQPAQPLTEPTEAMITAYLQANDAYWRRTDELPPKSGKWRQGTPTEATRESLRAALAVAQPAQRLTDEQIGSLWAEAALVQRTTRQMTMAFARAVEKVVRGEGMTDPIRIALEALGRDEE